MIQSFVTFSFFAWVISLLGLGCFVGELIKKYFKDFEVADEFKILYLGILGLILFFVIGTVFNFFIPLGAVFSTIILVIGLGLFVVYRKNIFLIYGKYDILIIAILFAYGSVASLMNLNAYDTGLYHLPMINWISQTALPFGLADLHGRFGFNSSWFLDSSIVYPIRFVTKAPFFIINAILFSFYGTFVFLSLLKMIKECKISFSLIFAAVTFIPWFYCLTNLISSPSPDVPTMLLTLFVTFLLIKGFETKNIDYFFVSLILSFYIVTIKLSAVPYFIEIGLILLLLLIFRNYFKKNSNRITKKISISRYFNAGIILSVMGVPYLVRGIISSGYVAYPSNFGRLNLKWSVPISSADNEAIWIKSWARNPGADPKNVLGNWNWINSWFHQIVDDKILIYSAISGIILVLLCIFLKKRKDLVIFLLVFVLSLGGCVFWFLSAPAPRFGYGYLYSFFGILLSYGIYNILVDNKYFSIILKAILVVFLALLIFQNEFKFRQILKTNKIKDVDLIKNETDFLIPVFTPKKGDQCFDAPLLCTPSFNRNLHIYFSGDDKPRMFWFENKQD